MTVLLATRQLEVGHGRAALLPPFDFAVEARTCWAVVGPNGSGKSTLLRTLLGLQATVGGSIVHRPQTIGYVPQRSELDPSVPARVLDLVRAGAERGWRFADPFWQRRMQGQVERAMRDTEIAGLAREPFQNLSEGQKQRVLMAQALAGDPQLLVLDEPTSAMDLHAERGIFRLLDTLRERRSLGILVVSHHLTLLGRHASHALFVDKDQFAVLTGPVAAVARAPAFVERYGLAMQVLPAPVAADGHGATYDR